MTTNGPDQDVGERIGRQVERAMRLARWLRRFEIVFAVLFGGAWAILVAPNLPEAFRMYREYRGLLSGIGGLLSALSGPGLLLFVLVLAEIARRMVMVVSDLAEDAREII